MAVIDAQPCFERVDAPTLDCRRHVLGPRGGGQAAAGGDGDEGFELREAVHGGIIESAFENTVRGSPGFDTIQFRYYFVPE